MTTRSAKQRRITASEKRMQTFATRAAKHRKLAEEAEAALAKEKQTLDWVRSMPVDQAPVEGEPTLFDDDDDSAA